MKKVLILTVCMLFLMVGWAQADNLVLGNNISYIYSLLDTDGDVIWDPVQTTEGGGSVDPSSLNGNPLAYVYCIDLFTTVYVPGVYGETIVTTDAKIYLDATTIITVPNAGKVAWLLNHYGTAGQGDQAQALQAAIWTVINGSNVYRLDTTRESAGVVSSYNTMLTALDNHAGDVGYYLWMTPARSSSSGWLYYQGLVAPSPGGGQQDIPEPGTIMLVGVGLLGLGYLRKR